MPRAIVVLVTCPSKAQAQRLARMLVAQRLAACVNILPGTVNSIYRWNGKTEQARETLLIIKTTARRFDALRRAILAWHPYQVPEIIALPITAGHPPYLAWVSRSVSPR